MGLLTVALAGGQWELGTAIRSDGITVCDNRPPVRQLWAYYTDTTY